MDANVYIDGFNFYYGAMRATPATKWLNLESFCSTLLLPGQTLKRVRYFTAPVKPLPGDPGQPQRQSTYLDALETLGPISIHKGQFKVRTKGMPLATPPNNIVQVIATEEKGSDVNLATNLLLDAFRGDAQVAVVVSDDFDLIEPMIRTRKDLGVLLGVASPRGRPALSKAVGAAFYRPINAATFAQHQLPNPVAGPKGPLHRPRSWS